MRSAPGFCTSLGLALLLAAGTAQARGTLRDVLGIVPGMTEEQAHQRLEPFGTKRGGETEAEKREEGGREIWTLRHPRFTYVVLIIDKDERVQYVQGYLHKDRKPLRYRDVGDMKRAKQAGYYIYVWELPARGSQPPLQIQARGVDSRFPGSYSIASLGGGAATLHDGDREREGSASKPEEAALR
jgi:hypothetical protein